jgi:hypothetical protein
VPGLGADPDKSWEWPVPEDNGFNWLKSDNGLAKVFPQARVLLYNYRSAWKGKFKAKQAMEDLGKSLLTGLLSVREVCYNVTSQGIEPLLTKYIQGAHKTPMIFIGHSMGGLIVAQVGSTIRL